MTATITRRLVSLTDASDALAVSTRTIRRYIADGQLEAVRLGRKTIRIKIGSIERFADAKPVGNWRRSASGPPPRKEGKRPEMAASCGYPHVPHFSLGF